MVNNYQQFCTQLGVATHLHRELKTALTHYSFLQENKNTTKDGSRYIFLGQTAFKGRVAELLFAYQPATGLQLQNYLGNLFKTARLQELFQHYNLVEVIRYGTKFDWERHQHIFVYGLLGFMHAHAHEDRIEDFIRAYFLLNTDHLLQTPKPSKKDVKAQLIALAKQNDKGKVRCKITKNENGYQASLTIGQEEYCVVESTSYKYVQKKAYKKGLLQLTEQIAANKAPNPVYEEAIAKREEQREQQKQQEKEEKLAAYFERRKQRSQEIKEHKQRLKEEALERDKKRREAKQRAKERKQLAEKQQRLRDMGLQNISASKRRILEDRGILPKKK